MALDQRRDDDFQRIDLGFAEGSREMRRGRPDQQCQCRDVQRDARRHACDAPTVQPMTRCCLPAHPQRQSRRRVGLITPGRPSGAMDGTRIDMETEMEQGTRGHGYVRKDKCD